ncbi:MAG: ATP-binding protein [Myxococcaceae bacterium]
MSFERKLWLGYALVAVTILFLSVVGLRELRDIVVEKDAVIFDNAGDVFAVDRFRLASEKKSRKTRAFLITGDDKSLAGAQTAREDEAESLSELRNRLGPGSEQLLMRAVHLNDQYEAALASIVKLRNAGASAQKLSDEFQRDAEPLREELDDVLDSLGQREDADLQAAMSSSVREARAGAVVVTAISALSVVLAAVLGLMLLKALRAVKVQRAMLDKQMYALERSNEDLDAFAARVAHDVRSVLAPLPMTVAQLQRMKTDPPDAALRVGDRVQTVTRRAAAMMDALLAFSRGGTIGEGLRKDSSAKAVLEAVAEDLRARAEDLNVTLSVEVQDAHLACPPELLYVVALNLLNNAIKFTAGRPERRVSVRGGSVEGRGYFTIEDTGPGIPEDARKDVFKPFYRAKGTKAPGTGIGLATVERIVSAHDGRIEIESQVGRGTLMRVILPLAERTEEWHAGEQQPVHH